MRKTIIISLALCMLLVAVSCSRNKYEHVQYKIPDTSQLYVPNDFPDLSDRTVCERKDYNWHNFVLRIVSVEKDKIYLSRETSIRATYVIYGSFDDKDYKTGEFIKIDVNRYYENIENHLYKAAFKDNITKIEEISFAEAEEIINSIVIAEKPVIYLYPTKETEVKVNLVLKGKVTCSYPEYKNGWKVKAMPDGKIYDKNGHEYYCLYWEGQIDSTFNTTEGFCVEGSNTAAFLRDTLREIGMTPRETNEFIIYWLPHMQNNRYNIISFHTDRYEEAAQLIVEPKPDSVLRVYMTFYYSDNLIEIKPQSFEPFNRYGFTVIEWGGSQLPYMN